MSLLGKQRRRIVGVNIVAASARGMLIAVKLGDMEYSSPRIGITIQYPKPFFKPFVKFVIGEE